MSNKMKLPEIKQLIKENNIKGTSHLNKPELIQELIKHGVLSHIDKPIKPKKEIDERYLRLRGIRNNARQVRVIDTETEEETIFKSIYACAKSFKISPSLLLSYNGKMCNNRYQIFISV